MEADWSVELGADDEALEFPWSLPDGLQRFVDLQRHPELLPQIPEVTLFPELGEFLRAINQPKSPWLTAKCDAWLDHELAKAEAIYNATLKLGSYIDLVRADEAARYSFEHHEAWVRSASRRASTDDELPAACEFIVRRCWYRDGRGNTKTDDERSVPGFYVTFYLFGYGRNESQARACWAEGLRRVTPLLTALAP